MKYFYSLIFLVTSAVVSAQTGTIKGKLADSTARQNLQSATVSLLNIKDSSVATYGITKPDGTFLLPNIANGDYLILFTFQGYQPLYKMVAVSKAASNIDLHTIYLQTSAHDLGNINVQASPVVIKKDTVEMSANMFKTKPNAVAEDLFKKLPGVEVAADGSVKAQGESVTKVLVDGKRFFGTDPKMATRNIPTDMIDKVQVYDALSDQSTFSGFDDGNREKTINIITKKDRRKGYFGKGAAGVGTDGRYATNISANRFNGNQQISFVGQANNVNQQNFSIQDILGGGNNANRGGGGGGGMFAGGGGGGNRGGGGGGGNFLSASGSGIARTLAAGLNYSDAWSKFTAVNGSYFYNNMNTRNDQDQFTENFVKGDSSLFTSNIYRSNNNNQNHRFNFEIDQKLDTMNSILIRPTYSNQQTDNFSTSNSSTAKGKTVPVNAVNSFNSSKSDGYNFNNTVLLRHKFQKRGRSVSLNLTQGLSKKEINSTTLSYNTTYRNNNPFKDTTDQLSHTDQDGKNYGATLSYTEPMGIKGQLEANYSYNYSLNNSNQSTMKFNKASGKFDIINSTLTNDFENTNISNRFSLNYRRQISNEFNYVIGAGVQKADLTSFNRTKDSTLTHGFFNFFPTFSLQYNKNRTKNLRLRYQGSTQQPSLTQLQPVIDNSNQLNITSGNPNLKQEFRHNINLFYSKFDVVTFKNVFASINGSFSQNTIGNEIILNSSDSAKLINGVRLIPGAQFTRPVNINGAYNFSGFFNYGFPVKALKGNLNLTSNLSHRKDVGLLNNEKTISKTYVLGETVRLTMNLKERFDLNFSSTSTYNIVHYTNSNNQNTNYLTQTFAVEPTYSTKNNGWIFGSDFNYLRSSGQAAGYNQSIALWNASIAKTVFKNKAGEFKLSVFDLLNQNQSISRTATTTYVQDVKTTVLKRYAMLTFTYNLRKFGQQQQQRTPGMFNNFQRGDGGGRPGGMPGGGGFRRDN